jgi:hypothetical protein
VKLRLFIPCILAALLAAPLFAVPEPTAAELMANRARLNELQKRPNQLARLRSDAEAFQSLSRARREQVLQNDYDLHRQTDATRTQLRKVIERYSDWLDRLPDSDRQEIESALNKTARLAVIRKLRDKEWMLSQPRVVSDQWQKLTGSAQVQFLRKAREEDRQRRQQWELARRFWKGMEGAKLRPVRIADLDDRDQEGVNEFLAPMLSNEEKRLLAKAEGNWPAFPMTLVDFADRHPLALPGEYGPRTFDQLPKALQSRLDIPIANPFAGGQKHASLLKKNEGSWPEFGTAVATVNKQYFVKSALPRELWAYNYANLLSPMQEYVSKVLVPVLTSHERADLENAEGYWPKYPEKIQELVRKHALAAPPWETALYGPPARWDVYRMVKKDIPPVTPTGKRHD